MLLRCQFRALAQVYRTSGGSGASLSVPSQISQSHGGSSRAQLPELRSSALDADVSPFMRVIRGFLHKGDPACFAICHLKYNPEGLRKRSNLPASSVLQVWILVYTGT